METERRILLATMDPRQVADQIGEFMISEAIKKNANGFVIGLSGGVDSTVTGALSKREFDRDTMMNGKQRFELFGYILPSAINNPADEADGIKVAQRLGIRYMVKSIEPWVELCKKEAFEIVDDRYDKGFNKGNTMSEIRGFLLRRFAGTQRKLVVGTGNRDEDFTLGYYTLFGDGGVHLSPIGNLPKRLVREMAVFLGFEDLAYRVPTAGLEPGQTDFKDLGYDYDVVELIHEGFSQGFSKDELCRHSQIAPLATQQIKLHEQLVGYRKFNSVVDVVNDVVRRHNIAVGKGELVHPPIPEITLTYR